MELHTIKVYTPKSSEIFTVIFLSDISDSEVAVMALSSIFDSSLLKSISSIPVKEFTVMQTAFIPKDFAVVNLAFIMELANAFSVLTKIILLSEIYAIFSDNPSLRQFLRLTENH